MNGDIVVGINKEILQMHDDIIAVSYVKIGVILLGKIDDIAQLIYSRVEAARIVQLLFNQNHYL